MPYSETSPAYDSAVLRVDVDTRERASPLLSILSRMDGVELRPRCLKSGDYAVGDIVGIERKTSLDFARSVIDGRLFRQAAHLARTYARPILLLEGDGPHGLTPAARRGALVSLASAFRIPTLVSRSPEESAELLRDLFLQTRRRFGDGYVRAGTRPRGDDARRLFILQGFPGIGPARARRLLAHFGNLAGVFAAGPRLLKQVDGIGRHIAARLAGLVEARTRGYTWGMTSLKSRPVKTVDDYMSLPEGTRAELIEGVLLMSPSPRERHQRIILNLAIALRHHVESHGRIYAAPFDVHLPSGDIVQPDVIYVAKTNLKIIQDWIYGAPDLLVEVVSPDSPERDRIVKRDLYAKNGVPEYWIVDGEERSVEVLALAGAKYASHGWFREGEDVTSPILEGLSLPAKRIFA